MTALAISDVSTTDLLHRLQWRYAVKRFDASKKIPQHHWEALENALVLSPSSYGLQPWKFIVVNDPQTRQDLLRVSMGQRQVVDSSHLVVFAARTDITAEDVGHWLERVAEIREVPLAGLNHIRQVIAGDLVTGPRHQIAAEWAKRQAYLSLGVFITSAAMLGVDTCPMEGFDPAGYDQILGLKALGYTTAVIATAGYRSDEDHSATEAKVRFPVAEVVLAR